jgi:hypothetical protein
MSTRARATDKSLKDESKQTTMAGSWSETIVGEITQKSNERDEEGRLLIHL